MVWLACSICSASRWIVPFRGIADQARRFDSSQIREGRQPFLSPASYMCAPGRGPWRDAPPRHCPRTLAKHAFGGGRMVLKLIFALVHACLLNPRSDGCPASLSLLLLFLFTEHATAP